MEIIQGQNITEQTFTAASDKKFVACNIESCKFEGATSVEFERCNVKKTDFSEAEYSDLLFTKSNIIECNIDKDKVVLVNSNIIDEEEAPEMRLVENIAE